MNVPPAGSHRWPTWFDRLLRYVTVPVAAGAALGFALLWFNNDQPSQLGGSQPVGGYADAVARAAPAVVNIFTRRAPKYPLCELPQYRAFCQRFLERGQRMQGSLGSGVMVREDGYILTNHHVVVDSDDIVVAFNDGEEARGEVVGSDPITDLAVVRVAGSGFPAMARASSQDARVGDIVLAIGNPFGIGQAVSLGIVSAKGRYGTSRMPYDDLIQTDAAVNPGNSGGALVDQEGRLLGINTLIYSQSGGSDGVGFAIPVERAIHVLEEIIEHGRALHGQLGVSLAAAPDNAAKGLHVLGVWRGTPAHAAGLRPGDILLAINGQPATDGHTVYRQIRNTEPGERLSLRILRNGAVRAVEATARELPAQN